MREPPKERLDNIVSLVTDKTTGHKDPTKPYLGLEHLPSMGSSVLGTSPAEDSVSINNKFRAGDILFGKLRPRLRKSVRVEFDGYCSTDILVLRAAGDAHPSFAGFVLQSDAAFSEAIRTEEGTKMPRCSWGMLRKLRVFCPDNGSQRSIAEVLSTIDEAIEQTEALIAKTQQIKAGLMQDLFTRGVTADGQLRPRPEEAPQLYKESPLGWIPKEWGAARLDDVRDPRRAITYGVLKPGPFVEDGVPLLQIEDVIYGDLDFARIHRISGDLDSEYSRTRVSGGEIVISLVGTIGRVAHLPVEMERSNLHRNLGLIAIDPAEAPKYFFYFLQTHTCAALLARTTIGSTQSLLNLASLRDLSVPLPAHHERRRAADTLDAISGRIAIEQEVLQKLRQEKAGLMHDLLTGRVRVPVAEAEKVAAHV